MEAPLVLRPIRFPLKLKLISLFSLVLLTSMAAYAHYALTRFIEDKSAYIFSSVQEVATGQSRNVSQLIDEAKRALQVMAQMSSSEKTKKVFESFPSLIDYREYNLENKRFSLGIADPTALTRNNLEQSQLDLIATAAIDQVELLPPGIAQLDYPYKNHPIVSILRKTFDDRLQIAQLSLSDVLNSRSDSIRAMLISPNGKALTTNDENESQKLFNIVKEKFLNQHIKQGVKEESLSSIASLIGVQTSNPHYPISIAVIGRAEAFAVADSLIEKSYFFAIFLLSIAIIIGILFSRSLTKSLETLFNGTQRFVSGNFESRVEVSSRDEIGALSDSFNYMGQKIVAFMEEMKEKVRLEREVEVAKLVQDSFFPASEGSLPGTQFAAFYTPASECGGDWWGHIEASNKTILFIADATGHGVPAALITATANCGLHTLAEVLKTNPSLVDKPGVMLQWFNKAICGAGKQLYMTMLCLVIDEKNKKITWANAAHNPALILPASIKEPTRQSLIALLTNPSPHLGKDLNSKFEQKSMDYQDGDTLILFTDGIVENTNSEEKAYGDRRFHQSIVAGKNSNIALWRDTVAKEALAFCADQASEDDVTLVMCLLGKSALSTNIEKVSEDTVISHLDAEKALDFLHSNSQVHHLVGANSPRLQEELDHVPPLAQNYHFQWQGKELNSFRQAINQFLDTQEFPGWFESPRDYLRLIGDELVTNALEPYGTKVQVKLAIDNEGIIVEVEDDRGALEQQTLLDSLKRARDTHAPKEGGRGAGLGLYLVYQSTNQIWIAVNPQKSTKVLCVLEATKRYKHFKSRLTSFHFMTQENS